MAPNTEKLLELLQNRHLVPAEVLSKLRSRAEKQDASPRAVMKYLTEQGHLTAAQADNLLKSLDSGDSAKSSSSKSGSKSSSKSSGKTSRGDDFGGLEPLDSRTSGLESIDSLLNDPTLGAPVNMHAGKKQRFGKSKWDTKLMLYGGGGLLGILLLIALFWFLIKGQSEGEMFEAAETAYNSGAYTDAIGKYDKYLEAFPQDKNSSIAAVHRGLARMRQVVDTKNWEESLNVTKDVLKEIRQEKQFAEARGELTSMLPAIAAGLVEKANQEQSLEALNKADEAFKLADDKGNIPEEMQAKDRMREIQTRITNVKRLLMRDQRLAEAVTEINAAVAANDTATAYKLRKELLAEYPGLMTDATLQEAVLAASQAERGLVRYVAENIAAVTDPYPATLAGEYVTVSTSGNPAGGVGGEFLTAISHGYAYSLDAADGHVLWRQFVGFDSLPVVNLPGGDVLLFNSAAGELVRMGGRDGALRWRLALGAMPVDVPVVTSQGAFVPTNDRRLRMIDLSNGAQQGYYEFPQGLRSSPAVDRNGNFLYLLGEHSNLFVINHGERNCSMVMHVGHESGEIHVSPYLVGAYLVIPKDSSLDSSTILVYEATNSGAAVEARQSNLETRGHVYHPPAAAGKLIVVSTDRGGHYVYDVKPANAQEPLTSITQLAGTATQTTVPYTLLRGAEFWSAGQGLIKYEIQPTSDQVAQRWARNNEDTYVQPLRIVGDVMFAARRRANFPGDAITASSVSTGETIWESHLAVPLVDRPWLTGDGSLAAVSAAGEMYTVPASGGTSGPAAGPLVLAPASSAPLAQMISPMARLQTLSATESVVAETGTTESLVWTAARNGLKWTRLPGTSAAPPLSFRGGLLVPATDGRVYLVQAEDGKHVMDPFQPKIAADTTYDWIGSANVAGDDVLLYDGNNQLYRVGVKSEPKEHLDALANVETSVRFQKPFARLTSFACSVNEAGALVPIGLADGAIRVGEPLNVGGKVTWGPQVAGDLAVFGTASGQILALDDSGNLAWPAEQTTGENNLVASPVGAPLADGSGCWISEKSGQIVHVSSTGAIDQRIDVGRPLASGPLEWNGNFVVAGADGTLLMVKKP